MNEQENIAELTSQLAGVTAEAMPRERAQLLAQLASACARAGMPREGLDAVKEALRLTKAHVMLFEQAEALNAASMCHYARGDHLMAIASGLDAYQGFSRSNELVRMGHALTTIAASCKEINAVDLSIEALEGCLNIAHRSGDAFLEARSRNTLGIVMGEVGRFDEAEQHFSAARRCLETMGASTYLPKVIANFGSLFKKRAEVALAAGDGEGARQLLRHAMDTLNAGLMSDGDANLFEKADKFIALAEYHFLLEEYPSARVRANEALELGKRLKHSQIVIESYLYLGRISLALGDTANAESNLKLVLELSRGAELRDLQLQAHRNLAECYVAMYQSLDAAAQSALANELEAGIRAGHQDAQREARQLWAQYFSRHPLIEPAA